jgi:hypothetical protein
MKARSMSSGVFLARGLALRWMEGPGGNISPAAPESSAGRGTWASCEINVFSLAVFFVRGCYAASGVLLGLVFVQLRSCGLGSSASHIFALASGMSIL